MDSAILSKHPSVAWVSSKELSDRVDSFVYKWDILENDKLFSNNKEFFELEELLLENHRGKGIAFNGSNIEGVPILKVRNLSNYGIQFEGVDLIAKEEAKKNEKFQALKGDVLLAVTGEGSLGKVDLYLEDFPTNVDGHVCILRPKKDRLDSGYLKAFIQSYYGQVFIRKYTIGSTGQTELYSKDINKIRIFIPSSFEIQEYIGDKVRKANTLRNEAKNLREAAYKLFNKHINLEYQSSSHNGFNVRRKKPLVIKVSPDNLGDRLTANSYNLKYLAMTD
ncbi:restriction endonuclease subunit S, partial [Priestia megaterium]